MLTTRARRARQAVCWAGIACAAVLVTACDPSGSSVAAPAAASTRASTASPAGTSTFLAQGQDINGTLLHKPSCPSGCPISGDSTAILDKMTWHTWSATEAVGTGIYRLDACNPNCAAGPVYPVAAVVTLSHPVKACLSSGTRWIWTRASFLFPDGLPKALRGDGAPQNPWVFSTVASAARQSCASRG